MTIWYLSFVGKDGWLGCSHVEADSFEHAVERSHMLGINPGGEVAGAEMLDTIEELEPEYLRLFLNKFMTPSEFEAFNEPIKMFDEDGHPNLEC